MSRQDPDYVEIDCDIVHATDRAVLISMGTDEETWVPRSVIENAADIPSGRAAEEVGATLMIAEWFATKEGLI